MKLSSAYLIALNLFVVAKGQALQYCAWSDTLSCGGSGLCCNEADFFCCFAPAGFGFSWSWSGLPSASQGQVYSDTGCSDFIDVRFGPGDQCWSGGGQRGIAANWFHSGGRNDTVASRETKCTVADILTYTDGAGNKKVVQLPATEEEVMKAVTLLNAKDWASLAKYPAANLN